VRNPRLFARLDVFITDVVANLRQAGVAEAEIDQLIADLLPLTDANRTRRPWFC